MEERGYQIPGAFIWEENNFNILFMFGMMRPDLPHLCGCLVQAPAFTGWLLAFTWVGGSISDYMCVCVREKEKKNG